MAERLKILSLVHNLYYGGDETRLLAFAKSYDRTRFEHIVASIHLPDPEYVARNGNMRGEFAEAGVDVVELGERHHATKSNSIRPDHVVKSIAALLRIVGKVRRIVREQGIDIIDARLSSPILVGSLAARTSRIPSVGTTYSIEGRPALPRRIATQVSFGLTNVLITDSDIWRDRIRKSIISPFAKVVNIPNGIYRPATTTPEAEVRHLLGIPDDPTLKLICQVSRLMPYKGHAVLLEAAQRVLDECPDAFFLLVGHDQDGGTYTRQLNQQAKTLGIEHRVRVVGYKNTIGDVWQLVDVHAHASKLDSLPNAIIEGMSFGKPAVVTSVGGIPDLVTHEETGLVIPPSDPNSLAQGILRLLKDPPLAAKLGAAAKQRYEECYTPEVMSRRLEDLFLSLCKRAR